MRDPAHRPRPATQKTPVPGARRAGLARVRLGTPADIDALGQKITRLEQDAIDLRLQLEQRDEDLTAARAANRELMAQLITTARRRQQRHFVVAPHLWRA